MTTSLGLIYTFYSYKGGVGRSMALANVATLLAQAGKAVLMVDFDLEAPGLERYFKDLGAIDARKSTPGVTDLVLSHANKTKIDWRTAIIALQGPAPDQIKPGCRPACLHFISASRRAHDGSASADTEQRSIDWASLFERHDIGEYLRDLRNAWREQYDIVLIDSRTGISDVGGICTIILPDVLVLLFTANSQSIEGCIEVIRSARVEQEQLPEVREKLVALPILARDDRITEYEQSRLWREQIAHDMAEFFSDWLPRGVTTAAVLQRLYIPHVPYWSFGERRPVVERPDELEDPATLSSAYHRIATLVGSQLDWALFEKAASEADQAAERDELLRLRLETRKLRAANEELEGDVADYKDKAKRHSDLLAETTAKLQAETSTRADLFEKLTKRETMLTRVEQSLRRIKVTTTAGLIGIFLLAAFFLAETPDLQGHLVSYTEKVWLLIRR